MAADLGGPIRTSDSFGTAPMGSGPGMAGGSFLGTVNTVDQADDGRRQKQSAGENDGVVKDLNEHDVGSFLRAFSMVPLYALIGVLYIDKSAKIGALYLYNFICMCSLCMLCVCIVCLYI